MKDADSNPENSFPMRRRRREPELPGESQLEGLRSSPNPPAVGELDDASDYSAFLRPEIETALHRQALRTLFHSAKFNQRDGLDDYDEDYHHLAPKAADTVTADMRFQMQRRRKTSTTDADKSQSQPRNQAAVSPIAITGSDQANAVALNSAIRVINDTGALSVEYHSAGELLIIGEREAIRSAATHLDKQVRVTAIAKGLASISGHLGNFRAMVAQDGTLVNAALGAGLGRDTFDLVLDLNERPVLTVEVLPPGYFAPRSNPAALERALTEIPELVGVFEKPKFFDYYEPACAHGRRGLRGCEHCIDACPTGAISSRGGGVEVDSYLCQGCGSCTQACPSGAIRYAHPQPAALLDAIRETLHHYRRTGNRPPRLLFHEDDNGAQHFTCSADALPDNVLAVKVEAIGSVGMEVWLSALAYGASEVLLLVGAEAPPSMRREIKSQLKFAHAILEGMGYSRARLRLIEENCNCTLLDALSETVPDVAIEPAAFAGFDDKRLVVRLAVEHLYANASQPTSAAPLPAGAPFGEVRVDREACTLCMACVAVCPSSALQAGGERPALRFIEADCVQCGLCRTACPEDAVSLVPQMTYDHALYNERRLLHEESPFCCVSCGKPFATCKMIERMTSKLAGHWMFRDAAARRRLEMCEKCRVADMFKASQAPS